MWYIEAIQPVDGLCFIAERDSSTGESRDVYFAGAPEFRPVPVRSIATALWATRGTFQEKLFRRRSASPVSAGGMGYEEFEFSTLDQAIELVRRLYVASGPEETPGMQSAPPLLPTNGGSDGAAVRFHDAFHPLTPESRPAFRQLVADLVRQPVQQTAIRACALNALATMLFDGAPSVRSEEDQRAFVALLQRTALWRGPTGMWLELAQVPSLVASTVLGPEWMKNTVATSATSLQHRLLSGLLFRIPAPSGNPKYPNGFSSLGHHFCAGLADRKYVQLLTDANLFAPLLLVSLLLAAATIDLAQNPATLLEAVLEKSATWLGQHLPDCSLVKVEGAEDLIAQATALAAGAERPTPVHIGTDGRVVEPIKATNTFGHVQGEVPQEAHQHAGVYDGQSTTVSEGGSQNVHVHGDSVGSETAPTQQQAQPQKRVLVSSS